MFVYKKNQLVGYLNFEGGQHAFAYDNDYRETALLINGKNKNIRPADF